MMLVIGLLFTVYFILVALSTGLKSKFPFFWLISGIGFMIVDITDINMSDFALPDIVERGFYLIVICVFICFLLTEFMILTAMYAKSEKVPNIIIILGAQLNHDGPGKTLRKRLDLAYTMAQSNIESVLILSGGKGKNEPISEAEGMKQYLTAKGLSPKRIILEACSKDTYENLVYSKKLLINNGYPEEIPEVAIVTTNFHMFRAIKLAKKAGYGKCIPKPAKCEILLLPNYMVREGFAFIKDFITGRL